MIKYLSGNTVRLSCEFYDFDDIIKDPENVKLKIYDINYMLLETITDVIKDDIGKYHYDYTLGEPGTIYYEWNGYIGGDFNLNRNKIVVSFI